ncbi:MAG: hypothetical protein LBB80_00240 [Treponema sp.]|nr:hypothetical protein [Treponema sp.]
MRKIKIGKNCLGCIPLLILWVSCSAQVQGSLHLDGSADLILQASLEPRMAALIRSLSRLSGGSSRSEQVLDAATISKSLASAPGIKSLVLRNQNPTTIEGTISILKVDAFLAVPGSPGNSNFITYEQTHAGGRLRIALDRSSSPRILTLLSPEVRDYLSALMAPVATGESLSQKEYFALIQSIYGKPLADEITAARIQVTIDFPGSISTIQGGRAAENRAAFTIPLGDMLVLEHPLIYEVFWQ